MKLQFNGQAQSLLKIHPVYTEALKISQSGAENTSGDGKDHGADVSLHLHDLLLQVTLNMVSTPKVLLVRAVGKTEAAGRG